MNVSASLSIEKAAKLRREVIAPSLWVLAVLAWGVGDLSTTWIGYETAHALEATPAVHTVIERWGHVGHAVLKSLYLSMGYVYYRRLPPVLGDRLDVDELYLRAVVLAIPAAFALAGIWLTLVNLDVILKT